MGEKGLDIDLKSINTEEGFFDEFERPTKEQWKDAAVAALKGIPFEKVMYTDTYEGIKIEPIYIEDDIKDLPHVNDKPGFQSYVRGTKPEGFLANPWLIAQEIWDGKPEDFNSEAKFDLSKGQTAVTMVLDAPTLRGCDPADADAEEVGNMGLSVATLADMKKALDGIDLEKVPVLCNAGAVSMPLVSLFAAAVKASGQDLSKVKATIGSDPVADLAVTGKTTVSLDAAYDNMYQVLTWAIENAPEMETVFVQGSPYHNAGAASNEEVAAALATAAEYLRQMVERGLSVDQVAPRMRFEFSLGSNFFMEIAKLRAARILWSQIVAAFGGNEDAQKMKIHGRTSAFNKTVFDAHVNMLRITSEGFSGAVGGVDSMHLGPFDEPIRTPDRFSRRIARNVQIMLQEESRFTMPIDMGGGSYYIEKLTDDFAQATWSKFQQIEAAGGVVEALKAGLIQGMIAETAAKRTKKIEGRQHEILGTNMYANLIEEKIEAPVVDRAALKAERVAAVAAAKGSADVAAVKTVADAVAAAEAGATIGEMTAALAGGEATSVEALKIARAAEPFEEVRKRAEAYKAKNGKALQIFLANMGPIPQHKPRADFTKGFFEVAATEVLGNEGFATVEEAAKAAIASDAPVVVVCSTDPTYPDYIPTLVPMIKEAKPEVTVVVAGRQKPEVEEAFKAAGVDDFIHVKANCYALNKKLQDKYMEV